MPAHDLEAAFCATTYRVFDGDRVFSLRVGSGNLAFDDYLISRSLKCWGIVTAHNPDARRSAVGNPQAQLRLQDSLIAAGWSFLLGENVPDASDWPIEPSFCVFGVEKSELLALAEAFGQAAIVFATTQMPARLHWTTRWFGQLPTYPPR